MSTATLSLDPVSRLTRDLKEASKLLTTREARYLVDSYYGIQEFRKAAGNQQGAMDKSGEPHAVLDWTFTQMECLENQIKRALDVWSSGFPVAQWARSIVGIGPVISAGLLAHIDIHKAPTAGHIWRFAGLDPTVTWKKKEKRPWNASLKTLCWKIGESFVKVSNHPNDVYGKLYAARKEEEIAANESGQRVAQAKAALEAKDYRKETTSYIAYSQGKLPDAQVHARAKRYAVKIFLSHYQQVAWKLEFGTEPPAPYAVAHLGHAHIIPIPNWPV